MGAQWPGPVALSSLLGGGANGAQRAGELPAGRGTKVVERLARSGEIAADSCSLGPRRVELRPPRRELGVPLGERRLVLGVDPSELADVRRRLLLGSTLLGPEREEPLGGAPAVLEERRRPR